VCGHCMRMCEPGRGGAGECPGCGQQAFCSPACLEAAGRAPGGHDAAVCAGYRALAGAAGLPDDDAEALRVLVHAHSLRRAAEGGDPEAAARWAGVLSNCGDGAGRDPAHTAGMAAALASLAGPGAPPPAEVAALLDKDARNSYGVMAPVAAGAGFEGRRLRGSCLYGTANLVNHECTPNVARADGPEAAGLDMVLVALRDIPAGEELTASYFPLHWPLADRRERLEHEYGFACACDRCGVEEGWGDGAPNPLADEMDWAVHLFVARYTCPSCGGTVVPGGAAGGGGGGGNVGGATRGGDDWQRDLQDDAQG